MPTRVALALLLCALVAVACSGDEPGEPTLEPSAVQGPPSLGNTPGPAPTPCTRPDGSIVPCAQQIPATAWLIDVRSGSVTTLFESNEDAVRYGGFDDSQYPVIGLLSTQDYRMKEAVRFGLDGREASREPWAGEPPLGRMQSWTPGDPVCRGADGGAEVDGRFHAEVNCGLSSPDGRWMIYQANTRVVEGAGRFTDRWLVDLTSGARKELQASQRECQGDSFFGPQWSASSAFVLFGDCVDGGRIFVSEAATGRTRQISSATPSFRFMPDWSPVGDELLVPGDGGLTVLLRPARNELTPLIDVPWPAKFDPTGRYIFSPAFDSVPGLRTAEPSTTIYDAVEGQVVASLSGIPPYESVHLAFVPMIGTQAGFVAALERAPGCDGTAVYSSSVLISCVRGTAGPTFSPDGSKLALARQVGQTGRVDFPGGGDASLIRYDILIVDAATGAERVVVRDALGINPYPLPSVWNAASTHILVRWPFLYGP